jgi:hypothetical protein
MHNQPISDSCITNWHNHQARQLHLSVCPLSHDFIWRLHKSGIKIQIVMEPKYPSPQIKEFLCYLSIRLQPWLEIVTVSKTLGCNINCLFLSTPQQLNYGKVKLREGRRRQSPPSLAWLDITVRATRRSVRHTASRRWACVKGVHADRGCRSVPGVGLRPIASITRRPRYEYGLLCWWGGQKCMGNKVRGVAYITIDDTNLALWTNW